MKIIKIKKRKYKCYTSFFEAKNLIIKFLEELKTGKEVVIIHSLSYLVARELNYKLDIEVNYRSGSNFLNSCHQSIDFNDNTLELLCNTKHTLYRLIVYKDEIKDKRYFDALDNLIIYFKNLGKKKVKLKS